MSYPNLHLMLRAANRRATFVALSRIMLIGMSLLLAGLLLALLFDAVFAFASWGLIVLDVLLLGLCLFLLFQLLRTTRENRFSSRRIARRLEAQLGISDNALINSLELREQARQNVSRKLVNESIVKGEAVSQSISVEKAIEMRPALRAAMVAVFSFAVISAVYLLAPTVFGRGLARLIDPTGGHPPFTLVAFDVEVAPETIYHGSPASIAARLTGPDLPDRADIVFVDHDQQQRIPMYSSGPNEYLLTLDQVEQSRDFYIDTPKGRSRTYRLPVTMVPRIESAQVTYRYPEYLGLDPHQHSLTGRDVRAIVGSEVEIEVHSNLPLQEGTLQLTETKEDDESVSETIKLSADPQMPTMARGRFTLQHSGYGRLSLTGTNQSVSNEAPEFRIIAVPDRRPRIEILEPEPVVVVVEDWTIPVVIEAIDDVELSSLELTMAINGLTVEPIQLDDEVPDRRQAMGRYEFELGELGARPGDIITYYATAFDNHPSGDHFVDTDTYVIQVISNEEFIEYMRRTYRMEQLQEEMEALREQLGELQDAREQMLEELKELQDRIEQGDALSEEDQQRMKQLQESLEQFADKAQDLAKEMQDRLDQEQLYDMEQSYREMLEQVSEKLNQQADSASPLQEAMSTMSSSSSPSPSQQQQFKEALEQFRQQQEPFDAKTQEQIDQTEQQAEAFRMADQMLSQAERIRSVIQQQRELADRLQPFQNLDQMDPQQQRRATRLAREQELLRQELDEALSALEQAAQGAEETLPKTSGDASQLCQGIRQSKAMGDQDQAAQAARDGQGQNAHQAAEAAADKLESFLSQCNSPGGSAPGDLDGGLSLSQSNIRNSLQQLAQGRSMPGLNPGRGQSGRGMGGSMSRFSLRGPAMPATGLSEGRSGRMTARQAKGRYDGSDSADDAQAAESISVDSRFGTASGAGNLRGVPVGYRDQAEAYFRRLSEETP